MSKTLEILALIAVMVVQSIFIGFLLDEEINLVTIAAMTVVVATMYVETIYIAYRWEDKDKEKNP